MRGLLLTLGVEIACLPLSGFARGYAARRDGLSTWLVCGDGLVLLFTLAVIAVTVWAVVAEARWQHP